MSIAGVVTLSSAGAVRIFLSREPHASPGVTAARSAR